MGFFSEATGDAGPLRDSGKPIVICLTEPMRGIADKGGMRFGANLPRTLAALLLWLGIAAVAPASRASCVASADPVLAPLLALTAADPNRALERVQPMIVRELAMAGAGNPRLLTGLYAVEARAYTVLELDEQARASAQRGLALIKSARDPLYVDLLTSDAENIYEPKGTNTALDNITVARHQQTPGSSLDVCLMITQGMLENRLDRLDVAIADLVRAYDLGANDPALRVLAAETLAPVMHSVADDEQAQVLIQKVIDWDIAHHNTLHLSVQRFLWATFLIDMQRNDEAIAELQQARLLSESLADRQGVAFVDMRLCEAYAANHQASLAQRHCRQALSVFQASGATDMSKQTLGLMAQLDLDAGRPGDALVKLDRALDPHGKVPSPRRTTRLYELRARAEAGVGNYHAAFRDLAEHAQRFKQSSAVDRMRQIAAVKIRFATDREVERNELLQRELDLERLNLLHQNSQLRRTRWLAGAGLLVTGLLLYIVISARAHRRQLLRLATRDPLTGLANRRHTAELATSALRLASERGQILTVALIDLDHFKSINDRFGHGVGDRVLQDFARVARAELRQDDVLGRWGGEEFLLIMGNCKLDQGLAMLGRLRKAATTIPLPRVDPPPRVTLSAGLASNEGRVTNFEEIVAQADVALYEAKNGGRDLVQVAEESLRSASTGVRRALVINAA